MMLLYAHLTATGSESLQRSARLVGQPGCTRFRRVKRMVMTMFAPIAMVTFVCTFEARTTLKAQISATEDWVCSIFVVASRSAMGGYHVSCCIIPIEADNAWYLHCPI